MNAFSAFSFGLMDSLNPCNLSTAIILGAFLAWVRKRQPWAIGMGWGFVIISFFSSLMFLYGFFMSMLYSDMFFQAGRLLYCIIGTVFMVFGVFHLADWVNMTQKRSLPRWVLHDDGKRVQGRFSFLLKTGVLIFAIVLSALATIWPMNRFITLMALDLGNLSETGRTLLMLCLYSLGMVVPIAMAMFWIAWSAPGKWVERKPTMAKMILSAVLLGVGFTLVYMFRSF